MQMSFFDQLVSDWWDHAESHGWRQVRGYLHGARLFATHPDVKSDLDLLYQIAAQRSEESVC